MKLLVLTSLLTLLHVSYSQQHLQVFSASGGTKTVNGANLQGTIGEPIVFETENNFTQGFNQLLVNPLCDTLAKFIDENSLPKVLCLEEQVDIALQYGLSEGLDKINWYLESSPTASVHSTKSYTYSSSSLGTKVVYAAVEKGFCKDTTSKLALEIVNLPELVFQTGETSLCEGEVILELSIPTDEIQWLLDGEKIHGDPSSVYKVLVAGTYTAQIPNSSCAANLGEITISSDLNDLEIEENEGLLSTDQKGTKYQWYIELEGKQYGIMGANQETYKPLFNGSYLLEMQTNHCQGVSDKYTINEPSLADAQKFAEFMGQQMVNLQTTKQLFSLFPNPSDGQFTLNYSGPRNEAVHVELFNSVGTSVYKSTLASSQQMQVEVAQAVGVYLLVATTEGNIYQEKLVIE